MFNKIVHIVLSLIMVAYLYFCLSHLVEFISNQESMGSYVLKYSALMHKKFRDWTDDEAQYIMLRLQKDAFWVGLFVLQHSIMATAIWKRLLLWLNIYVSERLLYVLASCFTLTTLMQQWQSTPDVYLWSVNTTKRENAVFWYFFFVVHVAGWAIILMEAMVMDPSELIGLKQIYHYYMRLHHPMSYKPKELTLFFRHFRHAGLLGLWLILWIHPVMTYDRLLVAVLLSVYIWTAYDVTPQTYRYAKRYFRGTKSRYLVNPL